MKKLILPMLMLLFFAACKKDRVKPKPTDEKLLLDSIITVEANGTVTTTWDLDYDPKNRLTKSTFYHPKIEPDFTTTYTYDNTDNLLKSVTLFSFQNEKATRDFVYTDPEKITVNETYDPQFAANTTTVYSVSENRVTGSTGQSFSYYPSGDAKILWGIEYEYGDKKSPFMNSGGKWPLMFFLPHLGLKNEVVKTTWQYDTGKIYS